MDFKIFLRDFIIEPLVSKDLSAFLIIIDLMSGVDSAMEKKKKKSFRVLQNIIKSTDLCRLQQISVTFTSI